MEQLCGTCPEYKMAPIIDKLVLPLWIPTVPDHIILVLHSIAETDVVIKTFLQFPTGFFSCHKKAFIFFLPQDALKWCGFLVHFMEAK